MGPGDPGVGQDSGHQGGRRPKRTSPVCTDQAEGVQEDFPISGVSAFSMSTRDDSGLIPWASPAAPVKPHGWAKGMAQLQAVSCWYERESHSAIKAWAGVKLSLARLTPGGHIS